MGRIDHYLLMNHVSLRNNQLKVRTLGKLPTILDDFKEYTSNQQRKTERHVATWTWKHWDLTNYAQKSPWTLGEVSMPEGLLRVFHKKNLFLSYVLYVPQNVHKS